EHASPAATTTRSARRGRGGGGGECEKKKTRGGKKPAGGGGKGGAAGDTKAILSQAPGSDRGGLAVPATLQLRAARRREAGAGQLQAQQQHAGQQLEHERVGVEGVRLLIGRPSARRRLRHSHRPAVLGLRHGQA